MYYPHFTDEATKSQNIKESIAFRYRNRIQMQVSIERPVLLQTHHTASYPSQITKPRLQPLSSPSFLLFCSKEVTCVFHYMGSQAFISCRK